MIEIRSGPANSFDRDVLRGVADAIDDAASAGTARAVVLCSDGKQFCAGADFGSAIMRTERSRTAAEIYREGLRIIESDLPVVAAIHGRAVRGELGLACAADFRVASEASRLHANFADLGFHHGFGLTATLPHIIGHQLALDLLTTARPVDSEEAYVIGLVDRLAEPCDEREVAVALATTLAAQAPLAVQPIRQTMRRLLVEQVRTALNRELVEQNRLCGTKECEVGLAAAQAWTHPKFIAA